MLQIAWPYVVKPILCWTDIFFEKKVSLEHNTALKATWRDQFLTFAFSQESKFLLFSHKENSSKLSDYQQSDRINFHSAAHPFASDCVFMECCKKADEQLRLREGAYMWYWRQGGWREGINQYSRSVRSTVVLVFRSLEGRLFLVHIISGKKLFRLQLLTELQFIHWNQKGVFRMTILFEYCNCFRPTSSVSTELVQITWNTWSSAEKGILYRVNTFLKYHARLNSFHFTPAWGQDPAFWQLLPCPWIGKSLQRKTGAKFKCIPSNSYMTTSTMWINCSRVSQERNSWS